MKNKDKTRELLIKELEKSNKRITELEKSEVGHKKAKEELKLLSSIVEQSTEGMAIADLNGNLIFINNAWCKMHGYKSSKSLIGKNLAVFHNKEQLENEVLPFNEKVKKHGTYSGEVGHITRDGKPFPTLMTTTLLKDEQGEPFALAGIAKDITGRKQIEEVLKESEEKFRLISENSKDIICLHQPDGKYIYVSPSCINILGYDPEKIIGTNPWELVHPEDLENLKKESGKVLKGGNVFLSYRIRKKSGEYIWFESVNQIIKNDSGNIIHCVSSSRDITNRKQAEEALQKSEEHYRAVVENSHDGIFIVGEDYKFDYVNDKLCEIIGRRREEIIGHDFRDFLDEESKKIVANMYVKRQRGEKVSPRYEFNVVRKDGEKRRVEISSTIVRDSQGRIRTIAQILDITERKKTEEELSKYREHLEELVQKRTAELEEKNKKLTQFNKLFVDREFRIKELRDKVKELEEEARSSK